MSKTSNWIAKNLSIGGLVDNAVWATGKVVKGTVSGTGFVVSQFYDDEEKQKSIQEGFDNVGSIVDKGFTVTGSTIGSGINKGIEYTGKGAGALAGGIAKAGGASEETILTTQKVVNLGTTVAVGALAGMGIAGAAVAASAAAGTAGAAATTSGLAALGGGSIAAGGGGMAAGQAVVNTIVATASASAAATKMKDDSGK